VLRIGAGGAGALILVFWTHPTAYERARPGFTSTSQLTRPPKPPAADQVDLAIADTPWLDDD